MNRSKKSCHLDPNETPCHEAGMARKDKQVSNTVLGLAEVENYLHSSPHSAVLCTGS